MPAKQRIMLLLSAMLIIVGIWLSGWSSVHWFLYITPALFTLFGVTGLCPSVIMHRYLSRPA